ncbi:hypothetical protein FF38_04102 [Lucilia cuprina]|uniref:Uncharacterized protein n=1 Tax=Lucilia cuprina TaxID=7375 RepID=A0A0L0BRS6_LUCCU|nr:hypothetical protein FF38_04102 [Lucilia cuprina]
MKFLSFFLIAAPVLLNLNSVEAYKGKGSIDDNSDALNSNSIYRNKEQVYVRAHHVHKIDQTREKDISTAVVKDSNGNVQESSQIEFL